MGWWSETVSGRPVELGDEPIDRLYDALAEFSRHYADELGRKPTLDEFRVTLLQALGGDAGGFFADTDEQVVGDIVLRRKKVAKRQAYAVGDYFAVPLDGRFGYGRIVHARAGSHLVELYDLDVDRLLTLRQLLARKRKVVLNKHVFGDPAFGRGRWRVVGHEPVPADFAYPAFYGGLVAYGNYIVWRGDAEFREPKRVAMKCEPLQVWWPERVEAALRTKEFGEWPEVASSKADTFDNHDARLESLHEYFKIPRTRPKK